MNAPYLENSRVRLTLLDLTNYLHLSEVAQQKDLLFYSPSDISNPENLKTYVQSAVDEFYHKTAIPFIVFDKLKNAYAGCTRFGFINWKNKVLHIGWTWIGKEFQGTNLNRHMKFLMLQYTFETLEFEKLNLELMSEIFVRERQLRKSVENWKEFYERMS